MSLREGNEEAASFRTRIPRPAPAEPVAPPAAAAATATRATASDVKSAVAAAVRSVSGRGGGFHTRVTRSVLGTFACQLSAGAGAGSWG